MATAKSLKKLRSVSSAFLEDGGVLLDRVDGLLRDVQRTLEDLQRRELLVLGREKAFELREEYLNEMLRQLTMQISTPFAIELAAVSENAGQNLSSPTPLPSAIEVKVSDELNEMLATVADATKTVVNKELGTPGLTNVPSLSRANQRKKRRR